MTTETITAIVVRTSDYREYDKLITLLTAEGRLLTAVMRGVKKSKAKLKFAALPFAFCEYEIVVNGNNHTITGASPIEDLFVEATRTRNYFCASYMLEIAYNACRYNAESAIFLALMRSLKELFYSGVRPSFAAVRLCQSAIHLSGFGYVYPPPPESISTVMDVLALTHVEGSRDDGVDDCLLRMTLARITANFESKFDCKINSSLDMD